jgi:hypothetical protein
LLPLPYERILDFFGIEIFPSVALVARHRPRPPPCHFFRGFGVPLFRGPTFIEGVLRGRDARIRRIGGRGFQPFLQGAELCPELVDQGGGVTGSLVAPGQLLFPPGHDLDPVGELLLPPGQIPCPAGQLFQIRRGTFQAGEFLRPSPCLLRKRPECRADARGPGGRAVPHHFPKLFVFVGQKAVLFLKAASVPILFPASGLAEDKPFPAGGELLPQTVRPAFRVGGFTCLGMIVRHMAAFVPLWVAHEHKVKLWRH